MRYRLIKPLWGIPKIPGPKGTFVDNPKFKKEVLGPKTYEGYLEEEFVRSKNESGYNVYFFPNEPKQKVEGYLNGNDIDQFEYVYVDMDLKDGIYDSKDSFLTTIKEFKHKPSCVVDSGHGIHVYWRINDIGSDGPIFCSIQKILISKFKTDDSIWTAAHIMRAPGFVNTKVYGQFVDAKILEENDYSYEIENFISELPELSAKDESDIKLHFDKLTGKTTVEIDETLGDELPEKFVRLMNKNGYVRDLFEKPVETKGDRSSADMSLANFLIEKGDFDRADALKVLVNTQKAKQRQGRSRWDYALGTIEKACRDKTPMASLSAEEVINNPKLMEDLGAPVKGPYFLDCLHVPWRKKQVLGLIAGSGVGKTSLSLKIFEQFIKNNPDNDDIFFFFNLEMTVGEILTRWKALVRDNDQAYRRLYPIGRNFFESQEEGMGPNIQGIYRIVKDTCNRTGKNPGVICIDHIDALEGDFDLHVNPTFNAERSKYVERRLGDRAVILSKDGICQKLKVLAQDLNCFLIVQSQTTKDRDAGGDQPIGKNAAFGTSKFEWYADFVIGSWRPLNRVMDRCKEANLFVTAYNYTKMREENPDKDRIHVNEFKLIKFIPDTQDFVGLTDEDKIKFDEINDIAIKLREVQDKKTVRKYTKAPTKELTDMRAESKKDEK